MCCSLFCWGLLGEFCGGGDFGMIEREEVNAKWEYFEMVMVGRVGECY